MTPRPDVSPASERSGPRRGASRLDVHGDLRDQLGLAPERRLVAKAIPELDDHPLPVEVAGEVEQERLDSPLGSAVVRVEADRDRRTMVERRTGIDPEGGNEQRVLDPQVRGRESPSVPPRASPETTTPSTSSGRPRSGAAARTSPAAASRRISVDETPGTIGTTFVSSPSRSHSARSPLRALPNRNDSPRRAPRHRSRARRCRGTPRDRARRPRS